MTAIIGPEATLTQQVSSGVWMTLVVLFWDLVLVLLISQQKAQHLLQIKIPFIERAAAAILIGTAVCLFVVPSLLKTG